MLRPSLERVRDARVRQPLLADAMNVADKVQDLQARLSRAAKQTLDRRFGALYDKMYRRDVLMEAWRRVRANKGAPGIDEQDFAAIEQEIGVRTFLKGIRQELKQNRYKPTPVMRCWIEKPGKPDKRPLGIPIIRDRVAQMACKLVIEPIFETNFLPCSYGFRPKRSAQMAIRKIVQVVSCAKQRVILDADIKGFLDTSSHYTPSDEAAAKSGNGALNTFILRPLRLPRLTCMTSSSPRFTRCNTV